MSSALLEAKSLTVSIDDTIIIQSIDLSLMPGEILCIVGPNGAGKSTLLQTLSGRVMPCAGKVLLSGKSLTVWSRAERAQRLAVLSQQEEMLPNFTVNEVVALGAYPYRHVWSRHTLQQNRRAVLAMLEISALSARDYRTLSGGEQQRVQLARILLQIEMGVGSWPRVLLLDEPAAHLDIARQHQLLQQLKGLVKTKSVAAVMVVHDLNLALAYADKVLLLKAGKIFAMGKPLAVLSVENIRQVYGLNLQKLDPELGAWLVPKLT